MMLAYSHPAPTLQLLQGQKTLQLLQGAEGPSLGKVVTVLVIIGAAGGLIFGLGGAGAFDRRR